MFEVIIMPKAIKDLEDMPKSDGKRMYDKLMTLQHGLTGDVKKLNQFAPAYRLRSGDWRALFDLKNQSIIVHRILNRREAYR